MKTLTISNYNGTNPKRYVKAEVAEALLEALKNLLADSEFWTKTHGTDAERQARVAIAQANE